MYSYMLTVSYHLIAGRPGQQAGLLESLLDRMVRGVARGGLTLSDQSDMITIFCRASEVGKIGWLPILPMSRYPLLVFASWAERDSTDAR